MAGLKFDHQIEVLGKRFFNSVHLGLAESTASKSQKSSRNQTDQPFRDDKELQFGGVELGG